MPSPLTDENDALDALRLVVAPTVDPTLDEANELVPILRQCKRASIWAASTDYYIGATVVPSAGKRNGHRYELIAFDGVGVASGATEPSWPTSDNAQVSDGNVTWKECGVDFGDLWDMRRACYLAFDLKIAKAIACGVDFATQSLKVSNSQLIANLERQRNRYAPIFIA